MIAPAKGAKPPTLPAPHWLTGHLPWLGASKLDHFERWERDFDLLKLRVFHVPVYIVSAPKLVGEVLAEKDTYFTKAASLRLARRVFGKGLLLAEGELWRHQHGLLSPYFQPQRITEHANVIEQSIERAVRSWKFGETLDFYHTLAGVTLDISCRTLLAADAERVGTIVDDVNASIQAFNRTVESNPLPFADLLPTREARAYRTALRELDRVTYQLIAERRSRAEAGDDILSAMVKMRDAKGRLLSDLQIRDELVGLFLGGHETTASAIAWAFSLIAQNPDVEARLVQEIRSKIGDNALDPQVLRGCGYLQGAVYECLRLYPSIAFIGRQVARTCEIGGYRLEKGSVVLIAQWAIQRSAKYFENPLEFDPDRWAPEQRRKRPKWSFFPFGGGSRVCIGQQFVAMEAAMLLAGILRRIRYVPATHVAPRPEALLTLVPAANSFVGKLLPREGSRTELAEPSRLQNHV